MTEDKDLVALDEMVNEVLEKEMIVKQRESELATQSEQFAAFIEQSKRQADELAVLKEELKAFMLDHNIHDHDTGRVVLKLSDMGKYKTEDIEAVPEEVCKVVKSLDNAAIKAFKKLHGKLPEGVESCGYRLSMKVKEG